MKKIFVTGVFLLASLAGAPRVFALSASTDHSTYTNPATVIASQGGGQVNVYLAQGSAPVANTSGSVGSFSSQNLATYAWSTGSFSGTVNGSYQFVVVDTTSCAGVSYATCIATNSGVHNAEADFTISAPVPPVSDALQAQAQQNLGTAVYIFLFSMFGMIWLMRKH